MIRDQRRIVVHTTITDRVKCVDEEEEVEMCSAMHAFIRSGMRYEMRI